MINLFGNFYLLEYKNPKMLDEFDLMRSIEYSDIAAYNLRDNIVKFDAK